MEYDLVALYWASVQAGQGEIRKHIFSYFTTAGHTGIFRCFSSLLMHWRKKLLFRVNIVKRTSISEVPTFIANTRRDRRNV